jgi:hypothetical protein
MKTNYIHFFFPFIVVLLIVVFAGAAIAYGRLFWARWQGDLWRRQGIDISTTEVFFGLRPAGMPSR